MKRMCSVLFSLLTAAAMQQNAVYADTTDAVDIYLSIMDSNNHIISDQSIYTVTDADGDGLLTAADAINLAADKAVQLPETITGWEWSLNNVVLRNLYTQLLQGDVLIVSMPKPEQPAVSVNEPASGTLPQNQLPAAGQELPAVNAAAADQSVTDSENKNQKVTVDVFVSREGHDEQNNSVSVPVSGIPVTVNGGATQIITNADGGISIVVNGDQNTNAAAGGSNQSITIVDMDNDTSAGVSVITADDTSGSAVSGTNTVSNEDTAQSDQSETTSVQDQDENGSSTETTTDDTAAPTDPTASPATGDENVLGVFAVSAAALTAFLGAAALQRRRKTAK